MTFLSCWPGEEEQVFQVGGRTQAKGERGTTGNRSFSKEFWNTEVECKGDGGRMKRNQKKAERKTRQDHEGPFMPC